MPLYFRADFDNPAVTNAVNPSTFGYHHGKHLQCIRATHADNEQGPVPNTNTNWIPARELNWTYTLRMLNTDAGQQAVISSGARGMFSALETRCRAYADHI